jgi:uncharacterized membrane protein YeaQ/YmgE (transglycosylase-associated protein family)
MLILVIIVAGMFVGWLAQLLLGADSRSVDWGMALIAGVGGSFVGGLLISLIAGDGLDIRPSGFIGSLLGALVVTVVWQFARRRSRA